MSTYQFELKDYHAVKEAKILIDGITVLSGLNGSGKSTVARWLHHVVKVLNDFDKMVEREGISQFKLFAGGLERLVFGLPGRLMVNKDVFEEIRFHDIRTYGDTFELFDRIWNLMAAVLERLVDEGDEKEIKRIYNYIFKSEEVADSDLSEIAERILSRIRSNYDKIGEYISTKKSERTFDHFSEKIFSIADDDIEETTVELDFLEDGTSLILDTSFRMPLNLRNVVYINTQNLGNALDRFGINELSEMLSSVRSEMSNQGKALVRMIRQLISGDVNIEKNRTGNSIIRQRKEYIFTRPDGYSFNLRGAATGVISFSYILQLLKNGWIDDGTLLIIDEPECHLHPQWIVDYAKLLVLLNKKLGTKVLISSHNPDMVSAIQAIATSKGLGDKTNFYLAEKVGNEDRYVFNHLGNNIEKIFDSFNIALDRIDLYGLSDNTEAGNN